jgi:hypothetical protein
MTHQSAAIYTAGHSNRLLEEFLTLLASAHIEASVDFRARPQATRWPQFSGSKLHDLRSNAELDIAGRESNQAISGRYFLVADMLRWTKGFANLPSIWKPTLSMGRRQAWRKRC